MLFLTTLLHLNSQQPNACCINVLQKKWAQRRKKQFILQFETLKGIEIKSASLLYMMMGKEDAKVGSAITGFQFYLDFKLLMLQEPSVEFIAYGMMKSAIKTSEEIRCNSYNSKQISVQNLQVTQFVGRL